MNKYFLIHIKKYAFSESVFNTLYIEIKHKFEKISLGQNKRYKNALFFFREVHLITDLLLTCDSYMSWSTRFVSLKLCAGFSIFDSVLFLSLYFYSTKCMRSLTLKRHNYFRNKNDRKATQFCSQAPGF